MYEERWYIGSLNVFYAEAAYWAVYAPYENQDSIHKSQELYDSIMNKSLGERGDYFEKLVDEGEFYKLGGMVESNL